MKQAIRNMLYQKFPTLTWSFTAKSQNNNQESLRLLQIAQMCKVNESFIEFGFHPFQLNSVDLIKSNFRGLLLDGEQDNCGLANQIFQRLRVNCYALCHWITLSSLEPILDFVRKNDNQLGVLSVDIDGNDYWILKEILRSIQPEVICVEYNASFCGETVSVPYDEHFRRHNYHSSGWYHGASLPAFAKLLSSDYIPMETIGGLNAIFLRKDKVPVDASFTVNTDIYAECALRNKASGLTAKEQWSVIRNLKYVSV